MNRRTRGVASIYPRPLGGPQGRRHFAAKVLKIAHTRSQGSRPVGKRLARVLRSRETDRSSRRPAKAKSSRPVAICRQHQASASARCSVALTSKSARWARMQSCNDLARRAEQAAPRARPTMARANSSNDAPFGMSAGQQPDRAGERGQRRDAWQRAWSISNRCRIAGRRLRPPIASDVRDPRKCASAWQIVGFVDASRFGRGRGAGGVLPIVLARHSQRGHCAAAQPPRTLPAASARQRLTSASAALRTTTPSDGASRTSRCLART